MSNEYVDDKEIAMGKFNELVAKVSTVTGKVIGSPTRPMKRSRAAAGTKRGRLTEREEDEIMLADEIKGAEGASAPPPRLFAQPPNIKNGEMRDYQLAGLNWLAQLYHKRISGILADEMGLGKTLQSISFLAYLRQYRSISGPHLVVVPLSTLGNWLKEFEKWCPEIRTLKLHGNKEERARIVRDELHTDLFDVCVTSYEMVIKEKGKLSRIDWHVLVVDEAHRLKNEKSLLSVVLRTFTSRMRILLTGTPLQNNLHELWALLNYLLPKMFESSESFDRLFDEQEDMNNELIQKLHKILRPFMLRRLKADVEKSLLPKVETLLFVGMSDIQLDVYRKVQTNNMDALQGAVKAKRQLLNIVMQLRKAANHPYLFDGVEDRSLPAFGEHLVTNSGKMVLLDKLLPRLKAQGSRVLIFSQMTRMLDILEDYCLYRAYQYCRIDGTTDQMRREENMETFNADGSDKFLFLLSTRAGGLGINLATADIVILFDSDWNPQMDLQAMDRAHRIGQKKQVHVYRFVCDSTIEEKIIYRAELKLRLDALVVQQGRLSSGAVKLGQNDMIEMIRYGADKIFRAKGGGIEDEDIDAILARGQEKTTQFNEKLQTHVGMKDPVALSLPGAVDENIISDHVDLNYNLAVVTSLTQAMGKRERKRNYNEDAYYREALAGPKNFRSQIPKPLKLAKLEDWQFFDASRLRELSEKEWDFWERFHSSENPPWELGLSTEEKQEKQRLLEEGFGSWNRRNFFNYRSACVEFGRHNIDKICLNVVGKTPEEVRRYHKVFWERVTEIEDYQRQVIAPIERGEKKLAKKQELEERLRKFIDENGGVDVVRENLHLKYSAQQRTSGFTFEEDRFLLLEAYRVGYGSWDALRRSIFNSPEFMFDYYLKSRSSYDLNRRVDVLIRLVSNQSENAKKAAAAKKTAPKRKAPTSKSTAASKKTKNARTARPLKKQSRGR